MENNFDEIGIAGVMIPIWLFNQTPGLYDYLTTVSHGDTAVYMLELLKADKEAKTASSNDI